MKISYNWLQSHFNEKLPAEKLVRAFNYAFAGSGISGKRGDDYEFDAKILPDTALTITSITSE